jgi:hypothetical protein
VINGVYVDFLEAGLEEEKKGVCSFHSEKTYGISFLRNQRHKTCKTNRKT